MSRSGTLPTIPAIAAFIVGGVVLVAVMVLAMRPVAVSTVATLPLAELGRRVLIIVPHPDDEVLATGGTIRRLVESGAAVKVVIVTAGDSYLRAAARISGGTPDAAAYLALGEVRHTESLAAAAKLRLDPSDVISLGYADGATQAMWNESWDPSKPAKGRNGSTVVPYAWAADPGATMCGQDLSGDLERVLRDFAPDAVISPDPYETHPDHATVAAFATYAMDAVGFTGRRLTSVVHFRHYPYPWAHLPGTALNPPPQLMAPGTTWLAIPLSPTDEQAKADAIAQYRSQTAIADLGLYMRAFIRTNELFASRATLQIAVISGTGRPARDASVAVAATPRPVLPAPSGSARPRIANVRLARTTGTLWIGLECNASVTTTDTFSVGLRLFGPAAPPSRIDASVANASMVLLDTTADSIAPEGARVEIDGNTVWIAIPDEVLKGRTRLMVGASVSRGNGAPMRTAWREAVL